MNKKIFEQEVKADIIERLRNDEDALNVDECIYIQCQSGENGEIILQTVVSKTGLKIFFSDTAFGTFERLSGDADEDEDFVDEFIYDNFEKLFQWFIKTVKFEESFKSIKYESLNNDD